MAFISFLQLTVTRHCNQKITEILTANEVLRMKSLLIEAKNFAYSSATLNYTSAEATAFAVAGLRADVKTNLSLVILDKDLQNITLPILQTD